MEFTNGSRPIGSRASALRIDYDQTAGAHVRAGTPPRKATPVIDFFEPTPHRAMLAAAAAPSRRPGFLRTAVSRLRRH